MVFIFLAYLLELFKAVNMRMLQPHFLALTNATIPIFLLIHTMLTQELKQNLDTEIIENSDCIRKYNLISSFVLSCFVNLLYSIYLSNSETWVGCWKLVQWEKYKVVMGRWRQKVPELSTAFGTNEQKEKFTVLNYPPAESRDKLYFHWDLFWSPNLIWCSLFYSWTSLGKQGDQTS